MAPPTVHPSQVNLQRHQECCHCHLPTVLLGAPNRCPRCRHSFCDDCIIDTVEPHVYSVDAGNIVIGVPYGPGIRDCYFMEFNRQREFKERRAALPKLAYDGVRRKRVIEETESSSDDLVEISPRVFKKSLLKRKLEADEDSDRPRKRIRVSDELNDGNHMRPRPANSHVSEYSPPAKPKACPSPPLKRKLEEVLDSDRPRKRMKRAAPPAYSVSDGNHMITRPANRNLDRLSECNPSSKRKACLSPMVVSATEGLPLLRKRAR